MDESLSTPTDSKLPIIVAGVAILLSAGSLLFAWNVNKKVNSVKQDDIAALKESVDAKVASVQGAAGSLNEIQSNIAQIKTAQAEQTVFNGKVEEGLRSASAAYVSLTQKLGARLNAAPVRSAAVQTTPPVTGGIAQATVVTAGTAGEYKVVAGDTFGKIAKKHGVSAQAIQDANPGVNSSKLKIGQKIVIPAKK